MKKILSLSLLGILLFSCSKDFLERKPLDFASPDTYLTSETQAEIMLNGIYNKIDFGGTGDAYQMTYPFTLDQATDNIYNYSVWEGASGFARGQAGPDDFRVQWKWDENYRGISRANAFLEALASKPDLVSEKLPRYKAEAKMLRAYFYNELITFFGDVPLILTAGNLDNAQPTRNPIDEVVTQVLKDLDEAAPDLPLNYTDSKDLGRITKGAALALKARALLYRNRWGEAAVAAKACMDLNVYSLFSDYRGVFQERNEAAVTASEAILQVYYTAPFNPSFFNMPIWGWWPSFLVTKQLVDAHYMANGLPITDPNSGYDPDNPFMDRDPRFYANVYYPGGRWKSAWWGVLSDTARFEHSGMLGLGGFKGRKWVNEELADPNNTEGTNKLFIRYAEVLLTYAEAKNEASGPDATVYAAIDQLRNRINMTTLSAAMPGLSQGQMREVIRNERRIELAYEGLRLADIRRWKIGEQVMVDALGLDNAFLKTYKYPGDYKGITADWYYVTKVIDKRSFNPARDYLWPIPRREMNANKNMVQNPYYD